MSKLHETTVTVKVRAEGSATVIVKVRAGGEDKPKRVPLSLLAQQEREDVGGFSEPSKMPWLSWSTPAERCITGSRLREVEGSTCSKCYAMRGNYAWPGVRAAQERRFASLADLPAWTASMAEHIAERAARFTPTHDDAYPAFRWHDSGDLQSVAHLDAIADVAEMTQDLRLADGTTADVEHWLPTREYGIVADWFASRGRELPRNLNIRLSAHMVDGPAPLKLAAKYGLTVSTVHADELSYPQANKCPAYEQGGQCRDCRNCWDRSVKHVSYPAH